MARRLLPLLLGLLLVLTAPGRGYPQGQWAHPAQPGQGTPLDGLLLPPLVGMGSAPPGTCPAQLAALPWTTEWVDVSKTFLEMRDDSLALDAAGHPHVAYGGDHLYYAYHDGNSWHVAIVDPGHDVGRHASLELDAGGRPHIAYYDAALDQLKYAAHDGTAWQLQVVDAHDAMC